MALPGQRAAQSSYRAAVQSSRSMGRAVADAGGLVEEIGFTVSGGRWVQRIGEDGLELRVEDTVEGSLEGSPGGPGEGPDGPSGGPVPGVQGGQGGEG